jgi:hypothetical protein
MLIVVPTSTYYVFLLAATARSSHTDSHLARTVSLICLHRLSLYIPDTISYRNLLKHGAIMYVFDSPVNDSISFASAIDPFQLQFSRYVPYSTGYTGNSFSMFVLLISSEKI